MIALTNARHVRVLAAALALFLCGSIFSLAAASGIHDPGAVVTAPAHPQIPATPQGTGSEVVLTFEGLGDQEPVNEFYNGGTGGGGSGPGPNYGISFSANSLAIIDADAGGSGNFGGEPSPDTILFFLFAGGTEPSGGTAAATMNVPAGFTTGFSFFYSAINQPGVIRVYDGLNATGNLLATLDLPLTPFNGAPDPTGQFSPLVPIGVAFSGTARSVDFGGTVNQVGFDDITLGSSTPGGGVPPPVEPPISTPTLSPTWLIALIGLLALVGLGWRSRRTH